jgi:uncharacterized protein (DUF697 family)
MGYVETIHRVLQGNFDDATEAEKLAAVREVTLVCSVAAAAVTIQPLPLVDLVLLAPIHIGMVQAIGRVHGHDLEPKTVVEVLASFGASLVARGVVLSALKIVPVFGWAASASMAYAMTYAIGEVSHSYFASGRGLSASKLKSMYRSAYESKKREKEAGAAREDLKRKLRDLVDAYEAGLLSEEDFRKKKEDLLKDL